MYFHPKDEYIYYLGDCDIKQRLTDRSASHFGRFAPQTRPMGCAICIWPVETKYHELKYRLNIEEFSGATSISIQQEFFINLLLSNLSSLIKNAADEVIEQNAPATNRFRYQSNRSFVIGSIKRTLPKILFGLTDLSAIDDIFEHACRNKSQIQPGRKYKRPQKPNRRCLPIRHGICSGQISPVSAGWSVTQPARISISSNTGCGRYSRKATISATCIPSR